MRKEQEPRPADTGERKQGGDGQEGPEKTEWEESGLSQAGDKQGWGGAGRSHIEKHEGMKGFVNFSRIKVQFL